MPIVDVSGLTQGETDAKIRIRKEIKKYFAKKLSISESSTTVTFISDDTIDDQEHVMARLYSKSFMKMDTQELEEIEDEIVAILEEAGHPYNEAFVVPILAIRGRNL